MLGTQELEDFRTGVAALQSLLKAPKLPALDDLVSVEAISELAVPARQLRKAKTKTALRKALAANTSALLTVMGITPGAVLDNQAAQIEIKLLSRRERTFPLDRFARSALIAWGGPAATLAEVVGGFISERAKIDTEARRLVDLFQAALHCPINRASMTRWTAVSAVRRKPLPLNVSPTSARSLPSPSPIPPLRLPFRQRCAVSTASSKSLPSRLSEDTRSSCGKPPPRALGWLHRGEDRRHRAGCGCHRAWLDAVRPLWRVARLAQRCIATARAELTTALSDPDQWNGAESLAEALLHVGGAHGHLEACLSTYDGPAKEVGIAVKAAVDQSANTKGWEALVRICHDPRGLWSALVSAAAHTLKVKTLEKALADIDTANGKVTDSKFTDLSDGIRHWWNLLRPNETAYFDAVQRRSGKARRTIGEF